mmetsp:Transcript_57429/g.65514  ORF Transcript_57429/g.65514 Transcript_57429/m.65514 type:complete len:659 (-) Transcript_57429:153-2129(-)
MATQKSSTKILIQLFRENTSEEVLETEVALATQMIQSESAPHINCDDVGILINHISDWLVDNSSANAVRPVLKYLDQALECLGFELEDRPGEVEEHENSSLYFKQEFGTIMLSLITCIMQDEQFWKYRMFLYAILKIINRLLAVTNMPNLYRKGGVIKAVLALNKVLFNFEDWDEVISNIIVVNLHTLSKFVRHSSKSREYFVRKGGIQLVQKLLKDEKNLIQPTYSAPLYQACCLVLGHTAVTQDHRLMIWVSGSLPHLVSIIQEQLQMDLSEEGGQTLENIYFLILGLVNGNDEIQDDVMKHDFLKLAVSSINAYAKRKLLIAYIIGIIRRLSGNANHRETIASEILHTLLHLSDYLGKLNADLAIKELNATIGALASEKSHCLEIGKNGGVEIVVNSALKYFKDPKIIKTSLGSLINLSSQEENRKIISRTKTFYLLIYYTIEEHKKSAPIADYALKVILNTADDDVCLHNYISGGLYMKLLEFLEVYARNYGVTYASLRVLRKLCSYNSRSFDNFLRVLIRTYGTQEDWNNTLPTHTGSGTDIGKTTLAGLEGGQKTARIDEGDLEEPFNSFLRVLLIVLKEQISSVAIISEIILFLSVLEKRSAYFLKILKEDEKMIAAIKDVINTYRGDREVMVTLSEYLANLSIEDLPIIG